MYVSIIREIILLLRDCNEFLLLLLSMVNASAAQICFQCLKVTCLQDDKIDGNFSDCGRMKNISGTVCHLNERKLLH